MKTQIKTAGLLGASGLFFFSLLLLGNWLHALQWLLQASLLWFWVWGETYKRSDLNRLNTVAPLLENFGWANRLTLLRGYLIALTGGFLFQSQADGIMGWVPGLLYGAAAILDRIDGFVARKTQQATLLGAELDTVFDALGLIVAPLLAIVYGKVHWSYLLLSFAYYIFQTGLAWRRQRGLPVYEILPSQLRRSLAGFQMGFIALALLPCFHAPQTLICSVAFMTPVLLGFIVDWFVASGRVKGSSPKIHYVFMRITSFSASIFQPLLRLFVTCSLLYLAREMELSLALTDANILFSLALLFGAGLLVTGCAGRVGAAIILLLLTSHPLIISGLSSAILCGSVWLLLLGTGRFSLWQWDDIWVNRRDGTAC